jgi:hypothetical protein
MTRPKDDWEKPRSHGTALTEGEMAYIKREMMGGRSAHDVAKELRCATRTVDRHFAAFRTEESKHREPRRRVAQDRFYKSNFEL